MNIIEYRRCCPNCNVICKYVNKNTLSRAIKSNSLCVRCVQIGRRHSAEAKIKIGSYHIGKVLSEDHRRKINWKGKSHSDYTIRKMRDSKIGSNNPNYGKHLSERHRIKISMSHLGENNHFYGKKHSEKTLEKLRELKLENVKRLYGSGKYNPVACEFMNNLNTLLGINLQHAENGGEKWIGGYSVDGYDKHNNIVFEYDEPKHNSPCRKQKDVIRQQNIINKIHPALFIRYDELNRILYDTESKSVIQIY